MKRVAFYRRSGKKSPLCGLKEKVVWQLSKRPMTGRELCAVFGLSLAEFNRAVKNCLKNHGTAHIHASEWVRGADGLHDRTYTLVNVGYSYPTAGKSVIISRRSRELAQNGEREKNREAAKRRARLIKAGLYINELG